MLFYGCEIIAKNFFFVNIKSDKLDGGQRTEDGGQRTEDGGRKTEVRPWSGGGKSGLSQKKVNEIKTLNSFIV